MTGDSALRVALLYPELLGTYGDGGNATVLARRAAWRGHAAEVVAVESGTPVPESCDLYLLGGGEDGPQVEAARELGRDGPLHRAVAGGAVLFAVCAGLQITGRSFPGSDGAPAEGLGLLDCETVRSGEPRAVGELYVPAAAARLPEGTFDLPALTGFENHGARTRPGPGVTTLGRVEAGVGNGDGTEGLVTRHGDGYVVGTYLHGPVLARNPGLADLLLAWAAGQEPGSLAALDDTETDALRAQRLRAIEHGRLDGVATRTWRDRLLGRN
jgi:CobQ-like glutamine amidotransferase family enzyme